MTTAPVPVLVQPMSAPRSTDRPAVFDWLAAGGWAVAVVVTHALWFLAALMLAGRL